MRSSDVASIAFLLAILAFAVVIVEERWLRVAVAFLPTLLLVQLAVEAGRAKSDGPLRTVADRRVDEEMRAAVDELLRHIREFYLTCHLMGSGRLDSKKAAEATARREKELNRLLAQVTELAKRGGSSRAAEKDA